MAFNVQTFKTRTLTAIVFVVVMLAGLLISHWTFFLLFSFIHFGCWTEYQRLIGLIDKDYQQITPFHKYGIMIAGWCIMLWFTGPEYNIFMVRLHQLGWWLGLIFLFLLPVTELLFTKHIQLKNIGYSALGVLYISLSLGLIMDLRSTYLSPDPAIFYISRSWWGLIIPCGLIFTIWINDTMAYMVGSLIGKTSLSKISPKKTWEGTVGGGLLAVGLICLLGWWLNYFTISDWIGIASIAVVFGTFGDLIESKLKRMARVKDSGQIMPGHGGFLDRFDSLLLATPFVWLYVYLFIR
jgi:phosphatidate cytidylyltransferase